MASPGSGVPGASAGVRSGPSRGPVRRSTASVVAAESSCALS
ncbi:Uncharacterised protein [Mycobacteroides abscessus]|nr:Uncharacterised protein [Mycobacteroides abscessus]